MNLVQMQCTEPLIDRLYLYIYIYELMEMTDFN